MSAQSASKHLRLYQRIPTRNTDGTVKHDENGAVYKRKYVSSYSTVTALAEGITRKQLKDSCYSYLMVDTAADLEFVIDPFALDKFLSSMSETLPAKNETCPPFDADEPKPKASSSKKREKKPAKAKKATKTKTPGEAIVPKEKKKAVSAKKKVAEPKAAKPKAEKKSDTTPKAVKKPKLEVVSNGDKSEKTPTKATKSGVVVKTKTKEAILADIKAEEQARQDMSIPAPQPPEAPEIPGPAGNTIFAEALRSDKVDEVLSSKKTGLVDSDWLDPEHLKTLDEAGYRKATERAKAKAGSHWHKNAYSEVVRYLKPFRSKLTGNNLDRLVQSEKRIALKEAVAA